MLLYTLCRVACRPLLRCRFMVETAGEEHLIPSGRVIVCSNHLRVTDPPILACVLKRPIRFMAKSELFTDHGKAASFFLRQFGAFPVKRNRADTESVKTASALLEEEQMVGIFPQGGCAALGAPFRPKAGVAMLALQTRSPILPVWITYGEKRRFRYPVTLRFGEMITDAQTMQQTDRSAIRQLMATLTKTMEGLAGG